MKIKPTGICCTDQYVTVSVAVEAGLVVQGGLVKIPLDWLLQEQVVSVLDRRTRRRLIEAWSEVDLADPLF